jgi:hypothetical protein
MTNIRKISTYVLYILNFLLIIIPIGIILSTFISGLNVIIPKEGVHIFNYIAVPFENRIYYLISGLIENLPLFLELIMLKKIFINYKNEQIFNLDNARNFNYLGWLLIINPIMIIVATIVRNFNDIISTFPNVKLNDTNLGDLSDIFYGLVIITISYVMSEASKVYNEQKYTI